MLPARSVVDALDPLPQTALICYDNAPLASSSKMLACVLVEHLTQHTTLIFLIASTEQPSDYGRVQFATAECLLRQRTLYNDWLLYTFTWMLTYKCQLSGRMLHFLDERDTTKTCSGCGQLQTIPLWKRTYHCGTCGLVMDRDTNSAVNILREYLARLAPHTGSPRTVTHRNQHV